MQKQKYVLLPAALLCLVLMALSGCEGVKLPEETPLFLDLNNSSVLLGGSSYAASWAQGDIRKVFAEKITHKLKGNRIKAETGTFVNSPFHLLINEFKFKQSTGCVWRSDTCGSQTVYRERLRMDMRFSLYKNNKLLKTWKFCEVAKESVSESTNSYSICPVYTTNDISIETMLEACAQRARRKVSRIMKRNL